MCSGNVFWAFFPGVLLPQYLASGTDVTSWSKNWRNHGFGAFSQHMGLKSQNAWSRVLRCCRGILPSNQALSWQHRTAARGFVTLNSISNNERKHSWCFWHWTRLCWSEWIYGRPLWTRVFPFAVKRILAFLKVEPASFITTTVSLLLSGTKISSTQLHLWREPYTVGLVFGTRKTASLRRIPPHRCTASELFVIDPAPQLFPAWAVENTGSGARFMCSRTGVHIVQPGSRPHTSPSAVQNNSTRGRRHQHQRLCSLTN